MPAKKTPTATATPPATHDDPLVAQGLPPDPSLNREAMIAAQQASGAQTADAALVNVYTRDIERIMAGVTDVMAKQTQESGKHAEHAATQQDLTARLDQLEQDLKSLQEQVQHLHATPPVPAA